MRKAIVRAIVALHSGVSLRLWDRLVLTLGTGLATVGVWLLATNSPQSGSVLLVGGLALAAISEIERRRHTAMVWALASGAADPVQTLSMYEYLRCVRLGDLVVISTWCAHCTPDAPVPQQVIDLCAFLRIES